jgi:hypothetical protein
MIAILRQPGALAAHVGAAEVKYAHTKAFNAPDFPLDIGNRRHVFDGQL